MLSAVLKSYDFPESEVYVVFLHLLVEFANSFSTRCRIMQVVDDSHRFIGIYIIIIGETQILQGLPTPITSLHREEESAVISKHRISHHITDSAFSVIRRLNVIGRAIIFISTIVARSLIR